jgi:hypothetical protein
MIDPVGEAHGFITDWATTVVTWASEELLRFELNRATAIMQNLLKMVPETFVCPETIGYGPGGQSVGKCDRRTPHAGEGEHLMNYNYPMMEW